jgi:hypothetical protein
MSLTVVDQGLLGTYAQYTGFKNRIYNGQMVIDQRNAGASVTPSSGTTYTLDRWAYYGSQASKISVQQVTDAPAGFKNSIKYTVASQYSPSAGDYFLGFQVIEGNNIVDLNLGTASATSIAISLYIKASVAGTYAISVRNGANNRSYVGTVTATTSWAQQYITLLGDTSGTWATDNTAGLYLSVDLGSGSTPTTTAGSWQAGNYVRTSGSVTFVNQSVGATLNICGVQLEKGSTATSFDYRPYGTELQLCQRYYERITSVGASAAYITYASAQCISTSGANGPIFFQTKRASPTMNNSAASGFAVTTSNDSAVALTTIGWSQVGVNVAQINGTGASGLTAGNATRILSNNNNTSYIEASAEL